MRSIASAIVLIAVASAGQAETLNLGYQAVMHVRAVHSIPILDDPEHMAGTGVFRGLALFPGDEIAVHRYEGWFDLTSGSGAYHGYANWRFPDGSELSASYDGTVEKVAEDTFEVRAAIRDVTGTMRFAGATGSGSFEGRRIEPLEVGGATYLKGSLEIEVPR